ncbi:unnamed protein product [Cunninghamella blakesleeana]
MEDTSTTTNYHRSLNHFESPLPTMEEQNESPEASYSNHHPMMFHPPPRPLPPLLASIRKKQLKILECILNWKDKKQMKRLSHSSFPFPPPLPPHHVNHSSFYDHFHSHPTIIHPPSSSSLYYCIPPPLTHSIPIPIHFHPLHYYYYYYYYYYPNDYSFEHDDKTQVNDDHHNSNHYDDGHVDENDHYYDQVQIVSIPSTPNTRHHDNDHYPPYIVTQPYNITHS